MSKGYVARREGSSIELGFRELRNSADKLLCVANDCTGEVETQGPHKSRYTFRIPVGGEFIVVRDNVKSIVVRTAAEFIVADYVAAA